jgi:N-acetylglucosamine transport system permease protein
MARGKLSGLVVTVILSVYAVVVIYPMVWLLLASLKTNREIFAAPWSVPASPQWGNYVQAWRAAGIGQYFCNSVLVSFVSLFFILLIGALAAYVLARFVFRGRSLIHSLFLGGMMFPIFLGIVPLFLLLKQLGLLDTRLGLILVYVAYSLSFTIFVLTGFFKTIPTELHEAGLIDGCSEFSAFFRIMLPLAKPGLLTAGIFNFFGLWNEYPLALVIISDNELRTLPLGIANLLMVQQYETEWSALFAGLMLVMIPTILVYAIFQRQITEGISVGALKG